MSIGAAISQALAWLVHLAWNVTGRLKLTFNRSATTAPTTNAPLFSKLPFDIRHMIYGIILDDAGARHHIFCPSMDLWGGRGMARVARELQLPYLLSARYGDLEFEKMEFCGHYKCGSATDWGETIPNWLEEDGFRLADLNALMRTCKVGYQEVSVFLYRSIVFTFSSFPELGAFLCRINPEMLPCIHSISFIAHVLPDSGMDWDEMAKGMYFEGRDRDHVGLFRHMLNLKTLEISFFPNDMLFWEFPVFDAMKPLEELSREVDITVRVPKHPNIFYECGDIGSPPSSDEWVGGQSWYSLRRPIVKPKKEYRADWGGLTEYWYWGCRIYNFKYGYRQRYW